ADPGARTHSLVCSRSQVWHEDSPSVCAMDVVEVIALVLLVVEYAIKIVAVGVVPENRRPSSSQAWLLLILFLPVVGVPLFLLIGSPWVRGRRHRIQVEANQQLAIAAEGLPTVPSTCHGSRR